MSLAATAVDSAVLSNGLRFSAEGWSIGAAGTREPELSVFAFGAMQLFMGIGIDLHGVRRTVLTAFPIAIAGSALSALANNYGLLVVGQVLIGIGCAPAFLVCTVFIARHFPTDRFAAVSGLTLGLGGVGMLLTGTPLAWLIQATSWRMGFWVLGGSAALAL